MITIAEKCPLLEHISIANCWKIGEQSDHALVKLAESCPQLRYVNLAGCFCIENSGIERLLSISKNLEILDIRDVLYIVVFWEEDEDTPEFVNQIKTQYSNVDIKCIGRKINVQYGEDTANLKAKEYFDTNRKHLDRMEKEIRKSKKN